MPDSKPFEISILHAKMRPSFIKTTANIWLRFRQTERYLTDRQKIGFMSGFFRPNLDRQGRIARGVMGGLCLIAGIVVCDFSLWGLVLVIPGLFAIFEAVSKWCIMRACGIRTKY